MPQQIEEMFFGGEARKFGTHDQTPEQLEDAYDIFGETTKSVPTQSPDQTPQLILEKDWKPTWQREGDNNDQFTNGIGDQNGQGACGCISGAELTEGLMLKSGIPPIKLSWGQLYWSVNGGSDNGSLPERVLQRLRVGVASVNTCRIDIRNPRQQWNQDVLDDMKNYGIDEWFLCPTFEHVASALQLGFRIHSSIYWYTNDNVDADGYIPNRPSGRKGGHSIQQTELIFERGQWALRFPNTWTTQWGIKGYGKITRARATDMIKVWPWWAGRSPRQVDGHFPQPKTLAV